MRFTRVCTGSLRICFKYLKFPFLCIKLTCLAFLSYSLCFTVFEAVLKRFQRVNSLMSHLSNLIPRVPEGRREKTLGTSLLVKYPIIHWAQSKITCPEVEIWRDLFLASWGKTFWRFSVYICSSVAHSYIIISKSYSFKLKSNLQKLMQLQGSVLSTQQYVKWALNLLYLPRSRSPGC